MSRALTSVLTAVALLTGGAAVAQADSSTGSTDRVFFSTRAVSDGTPGSRVTYVSTLSRTPGDASTGGALTLTPGGLAHLATLDGYPAGATFPAGPDLPETYVLLGGSTVRGEIRSQDPALPAAAVAAGVSVELTATSAAGEAVLLGRATVSKLVVTPQDRTFAFAFTVPEALDGTAVRGLTGRLAQRGVGFNGFLDQQGGSFFDLPHAG